MTSGVETKHPLQIMDGLLQLKVPIPNNPLGWVLPYLIEGHDGWTLVDSGWNVPEAWDALEQQLPTPASASISSRRCSSRVHPTTTVSRTRQGA
jgi:hypothetical protein